MERLFNSLAAQRGILEIAGPERRDFLQGLITNDVTRLAPGRALYAALLTAQGRYLHDFFLAERGEIFLLDGEAARLADLTRRLSIYKLRAKVTLTPASERWSVFAAFGSDASARLGLAGEAGTARDFAGGSAFIDPRLVGLGARAILPREAGAAPFVERGFVAAAPGTYDRMRLRLGVPESGRDLVPEKSLMLESGMDELNAIDWNKGCYIGQELTARTKHRGLVKRRLMPVDVAGAVPEAGTTVTWENEEAGEMRSARDGIALALLRLDAVEKASAAAPLRAGEARLTPIKPDWAKF